MVSATNTGPTADEMARMSQKMFKNTDTNGDGKISKEEMQAFNDKMTSQTGRQGPSVDDFFTQFDSDKDGSISQSEFDNAGKQMAEKMKSMALKMGANGSNPLGGDFAQLQLSAQTGTINGKELKAYSSSSTSQNQDYLNTEYSTSVYA